MYRMIIQGYDCQAVLDAVASHACNALTTMYYLTQQKHKTALAKEKKLEELSYFGSSRNSSLGGQLDRVMKGGEGSNNVGQPGGGGTTTDGQPTKVSIPKPAPIQPGVLPTRPDAQIPSNSHGRPGSIIRPNVAIPTSHDGNKMINLTTSRPPTGGNENDSSNNSHNPAEGNTLESADVVPDLTKFTAGGNPLHAINNAHIAIAANRRGPIGASFRASFNANLRASVDGTANGTNLDDFSVANVIASARMAAGMLPPKQVPLVKLGHEAPSGAVYTDHPSEELRTYEGTGAKARGGGSDKLAAINRRGDALSSANGGGGAGTERQINVAALLRENQAKQLQLQQQLQEQLLLKSANAAGTGKGTTTAVATTTSSNNHNLTPLNLPTALPGMPTTTTIETSKTARVGTTSTGVAGGIGGGATGAGGSKSARGAREPDLVMPALNTVTRKNGMI